VDPDAALALIRELTISLNQEINALPDKPTGPTLAGVGVYVEAADIIIDHVSELVQHIEELDEWLRRGGFVPKVWRSATVQLPPPYNQEEDRS
jgi:hypothetical protein